MPTRTPHRRGDGDRLRAELLAAATDLLLSARPPAPPSLRAIARACGVAPSAVYLHFPSQAALLAAVVAAQFAHLRAAFDAADVPAAAPGERLAAMARTYVRWALAHPGAYQLLFEQADVLGTGADGPGLDLLDRVRALLDRLGVPDAPERALRLWCALHGLASLRVHKRDAPWLADPETDATALAATFTERAGTM